MLTPTQLEAVEEIKLPLSIKAGPGTGKTMLLVEKIAYLIQKNDILPTQILSLTFTQKAAKELSSRVEQRINQAFMSYTFHSFALSIMQTISKEPEQIKVLKDVDSIHFLLQKVEEKQYAETLRKDALFIAKEIYKTINALRDLGHTLKTISQVDFKSDFSKQMIITLFAEYEKFKQKKKVQDFHDLEHKLYALLSKKEKIAEKISKLYPFIIVDEFQDTSPLQYKILEIFASHSSHLTIVGDEKQSIYGFRGTHHNSFDVFNTTFPNAKKLYLKEQFRSSQKIVEVTNELISNLGVEIEQQLIAQKKDVGNISQIICKDELVQYDHILSEIQVENKKQNSKSIAILARTHSQLKELIDYASMYGVNISYGLEDVFNNPAIEKILFYLHIIANPKQSQRYILALFETLPIAQFIPQFILHQSKMHELDIFTFFKKHGNNPNSQALKEVYETHPQDIEIICSNIKFIVELIEEYQTHRRIKRTILDIMQREELYEKALNINDSKLLKNYNSMLQFVQEYERLTQNYTLNEFLNYLETAKKLHHNIADSEAQISSNVVAMTIHQAKGKEFDKVFMLQLNEKSFPLPFREDFLQHEHSITKEQALAEELRLFFVGITRAKEEVQLFIPEFNSKGTALKKSQYVTLIEANIDTIEAKQHELTKQSDFSKELLSKLLYAVNNENFSHARDLIKEYELKTAQSKDLRHYDENVENDQANSTQIYQRKDENGNIKPRVYSVSQLKTYETCPKKYYYNYICRIPQDPKHFFSFGTAMHSVFELVMPMFDKKCSTEEITMQSLHLLSMHWRSLGYESVAQEKEYFQKALQAINDFIDKEQQRRELGFKSETLEQEFKIELGEKKHQLMGFIDRIDSNEYGENEYMILDYKTSKSMAYQSQLVQDLQLYIYAIALKQLKGVWPKSMALWYVIHNRIAEVQFDEKNAKIAEEKLIKGIEAIESNNFKATPTFFGCTYCDFKDICKDSLK